MYVFQSGLGTIGEGKLLNRENARLYGTVDQEHAMFVPDTAKIDRFYSDIAARAAGTQVWHHATRHRVTH